MTTTVFMLDGFGYTGFLQYVNIVTSLGGNRVQVPYDNTVGNSLPNVTAGAANLNTFLTNPIYAADTKIVVGISMGTQVALKWQRDYGPTSSVPSSGAGKLSFIHLASPENRFTGAAVIAPEIYGGGYGGCGLPSGGTAYETLFVNRQYDGVCDYPNVPGDTNYTAAVVMAVTGMVIIHLNYFTINLTDLHQSHVEGNVTYSWYPTYPLPNLETWKWLKAWTRTQDRRNRRRVESAYSRPVAMPTPTYSATSAAFV